MAISIDTNLKLSPADPRDYIAKLAPVSLPASVDLKPLVVEVEDQTTFNSCTATAGCSALELMINLNGYKVDLSRMYLYYYIRQLSGIEGDGGAYPRDIGAALLHKGTCYESTWNYLPEHIVTEPSNEAVSEATNFKIASYAQITSDTLNQIKLSVAQNIPVLLTIRLLNDFRNVSGPWQTHDWNRKESKKNPFLGFHEVLVIGYDDASQRLLVENSWGPNWADGGFFGLPYDAVVPEIVPELWVVILNPETITHLENNPPPPVVIEPSFPPIVVKPPSNLLLPKIIAGVIMLVAIVGAFLFNR